MIDSFKKYLAGAWLLLFVSTGVFAQSYQLVLQPNAAAGKDAMLFHQDINDTYGNVNHGPDPSLRAERWSVSGKWYTSSGLIAFDLSSIPSNAIVSSASLTLYGSAHCNTCNSNSTTNASLLARVAYWDENTVTWNNQPPSMAVSPIPLPASTSATQDYTIDVQAHVQDMVANPSSNYGWRLSLQSESGNIYRSLYFYSSDASNPAKWPKLVVNYYLPATSYVPGFQGGTNAPPPLNTSLEVGTTQGSFAVSQSGAATYTIPLMVPPGTAGVAPTLSVAYNSFGSDGVLGKGWALSGLSSISRAPQSLYYNNRVAPVSLTNADNFLIDGTYLIPDSGSNGMDKTRYATEMENFSRITSYGQTGNSPGYFKVETKEGMTLEFGNSADSRIEASGSSAAITWLLNKVSDNRGNYMAFHYFENNSTGEFRPDYIEYTGTASFAPYNRVKFVYSTRNVSDKQTSYVAGYPVQQNVLLTSVQMEAPTGTRVHEYDFNYSYDMATHLSEVIEKDKNSKQFNSTKIVWDSNYSLAPVRHDIAGFTKGPTSNYTPDINGDGYADIVELSPGSWQLRVNDGNMVFSPPASNGSGTIPEDTATILLHEYIVGMGEGNGADLNGDGYDDMIVFCHSAFHDPTFRYYISNKTGLVQGSAPVIPYLNFNPNSSITYTLGDFDGDGTTDLFTYETAGRWCFYSFKTGSAALLASGTTGAWGNMDSFPFKFFATDVNGDGRNEITVFGGDGVNSLFVAELVPSGNTFTLNQINTYTSNYPADYGSDVIMPADFNGDGKTDLLVWNSTAGNWKISFSNGISFVTNPTALTQLSSYSNVYSNPNIYQVFAVDVNGDGKADIVQKSTDGVHLHGTDLRVLYGTGSGVNFLAAPLTHFNETYSETNFVSSASTAFGDFNGDGHLDLLLRDGNFGQDGGIFTFLENKDIHKVHRIINGFNATMDIDYKTLPLLAKQSQYTKEFSGAFPIIDLQNYFTAVANTKADDGLGGTNETDYSYTGAKAHLQGKGFLGFAKVISTDLTAQVKTENSYYLPSASNFFQRTLYYSQTSLSVTPFTPIRLKTFATYTFVTGSGLPVTDNTGKRYYFYAKNYEDDDQLHGNLVITTYTVTQDKWGNTTDENTANSAVTSYVHNTFEQKGAWIPSRLTSALSTTTRIGQAAYTRSVSITNNSFGQPLTKTEDAGALTTYTYDDVSTVLNPTPKNLGNLLKTAVSGTGVTTRSTENTYDAYGRFVTSQTNALNQSVQMPDHDAYGNVQTQTDVNGLTTYRTYDGFERLSTTTTPTGKVITTARSWDFSALLSVFKVQTILPGTPTSTEYFDKLGRSARTQTTGFGGTAIKSDKEYYNTGQLKRQSEPYSGSSPSAYTQYTYDAFFRPKTITAPSGASTTYNYTNTTTQTIVTQGSVTKTQSKTLDVSGALASSSDDGGTIGYTYHSCGKPLSISAPGSTTYMTYDAYGRQTSLQDPDAGTIRYDYNVLGELVHQQDAKQLQTNPSYSYTLSYDALGRVISKNSSDPQEGNIAYTYDTKSNGKGMLGTVSGFGTTCDYTYDTQGRLAAKTENIAGTNYTSSYLYDDWNRLVQQTYPSGFATTMGYNTSTGYLETIKKTSDNSLIWQCTGMNNRLQTTNSTYGNGLVQTKTYSALGFLQSTLVQNGSTSVWNMGYNFDETTGNLSSRSDIMKSQSEIFHYDNLDRLTDIYLNGSSSSNLSATYLSSGNINSKSDAGAGAYNYTGYGPHAVSSVANPGTNISSTPQTITYTPFNKAAHIAENDFSLELYYGPDQQRKKSEYRYRQSILRSVIYAGDYEKITKGSNVYEVHYIGTPDGLAAINVRLNGGADQMNYVYGDHLGSINIIFDQSKTKVYEQSFDAWGKERDPANWANANPNTAPDWLIRGYTGHEHHREFKLINMNGRMYDPVLGRMLSADNVVQAPDFTQSYNRYSYVLNNPLKYIDPTGWNEMVMDQDGNIWHVAWVDGEGIGHLALGPGGGLDGGIGGGGFSGGGGGGGGSVSSVGMSISYLSNTYDASFSPMTSISISSSSESFSSSTSILSSLNYWQGTSASSSGVSGGGGTTGGGGFGGGGGGGGTAHGNGGTTSGQIMASTLLFGAGTSEVPPVAITILVGGSIAAGAYYLHDVLNPGLKGTHTSTEQPWMEPQNKYNYEEGGGPEWPKGSWVVGGAIAAGAAAYEYYDHISNQNTYHPIQPLQTDHTYVAPPPNPYIHR